MIKDTLRLLVWPECNRNCPGCCNKDYDLDALPRYTVDQAAKSFNTVLLTGGEPMLSPFRLRSIITRMRVVNPKIKIILYTAKIDYDLVRMFPYLDGLTVTLHEKEDWYKFLLFDHHIWLRYAYSPVVGQFKRAVNQMTLRVNIFEGIGDKDTEFFNNWRVKDSMQWIKDCPVPENEEFGRLP